MISDETLKAIPPKLKNDEDAAAAEMLCNICFSVPHVDPVLTHACDHMFCNDCISQYLKHSSSLECPVCRKEMPPYSYKQLLEVQTMDHDWILEGCVNPLKGLSKRIWQSLPVECPNKQCNWSGQMGNYKCHASNCTAGTVTKRLREFEERNQALEHENWALHMEITQLQTEYYTKPDETCELEYENHFLMDEVAYLRKEVNRMKNENLRELLNQTKQELLDANNRLKILENAHQCSIQDDELEDMIHDQEIDELYQKIDKLVSENHELKKRKRK